MQHNHSMTNDKIPDYEFHIPRQITYPLPVGIISVMVGGLLYFLLKKSNPKVADFLSGIIILSGGVYVGLWAVLKRITNLERRLKARDRLLAGIPWQGNETVLDVGCGNGILILGAAKCLSTGKGIGIDTWTEGQVTSVWNYSRRTHRLKG